MTSKYQHIFLIGFMGTGKTYWGQLWSKLTGIKFFDMDDLVEKQEQQSINDIFENKGEKYFRDAETNALKNIDLAQSFIMATGGGTPCFNDNISWMNENGTSVYLQSSPENILERLMHEKNKRPLIRHLKNEELTFYITEKIKERTFFYQQAKKIIYIDDKAENYLPDFLKL